MVQYLHTGSQNDKLWTDVCVLPCGHLKWYVQWLSVKIKMAFKVRPKECGHLCLVLAMEASLAICHFHSFVLLSILCVSVNGDTSIAFFWMYHVCLFPTQLSVTREWFECDSICWQFPPGFLQWLCPFAGETAVGGFFAAFDLPGGIWLLLSLVY